jgi:integrase
MPDYSIGRLNGRFVVSWWDDGRRRRYRLAARSIKEAEAEAIDVARRARVKVAGDTIADLWEAYRAEKSGRRIADAMKHEWKALGPHFGHLRPDQVTVDHCRAYTARRRLQTPRGKTTPTHDGTIWTELGHLRTVFVWAHRAKKISHAPAVERPAKPDPKDRYLTRGEIDKLLAAPAEPHIRLAILLMLSTAGRVGAILDLTWERVDFARGVVNLKPDDAKTRKGRAAVPMNAGLRAALQTAKMAALSDHVIEWAGKQVAGIKTGFNKAVANAGLENVTPHVLRHTAGVTMAEAGLPFEEIAQYMGHSNPTITFRVYGRFSPKHLRRAANVLDFTRLEPVE